MDLYERDLTITDVQEQDLNTDVENRWKSRIKSLEVTLSEYQNHIESLELQLKQYQTEGVLRHLLIILPVENIFFCLFIFFF